MNRRLYKTGDLARFEPNGEIVFCDRADHQIKLNGFRIELGEIEAALNDYLGTSAIVHSCEINGQRILVAYVLQPCRLNIAQLQQRLAQILPPYMIPAAIVPLKKLPLLPNGKVDRRALPTPQPQRVLVAPKDQIERQLVQIWQEILDIEAIGTDDNFFAIGGSSLAAVRLADRIQTEFGCNLPLATVFQLPSIAQFAAVLRQAELAPTARSIVALQSIGNRPPLFLLQGVDLYRSLAAHLGCDQPVYGLAFEMIQLKFASIEALAAHYLAEVRTVQPQGPYLLGGVSFGGMVALEVAQQLQAAGETIALLALFDTPAPNAFAQKPWRQRIWGHWCNLSNFGWSYVTKKLAGKLDDAAYLLARRRGDRDQTEDYKFVRKTYEQIIASYAPQMYQGCITLFLAIDRSAMVDAVYDPALVNIDPLFGWGHLALEGVDLYEIPGDHLGILKEPQVKLLAQQLQHCIQAALPSSAIPKPLDKSLIALNS